MLQQRSMHGKESIAVILATSSLLEKQQNFISILYWSTTDCGPLHACMHACTLTYWSMKHGNEKRTYEPQKVTVSKCRPSTHLPWVLHFYLFHCSSISLSLILPSKLGMRKNILFFILFNWNWISKQKRNLHRLSSMSINKMVNHVENHVSPIWIQEIGLDLQHEKEIKRTNQFLRRWQLSDFASTYYLSTDWLHHISVWANVNSYGQRQLCTFSPFFQEQNE
jgi:hypothetical protein